MQITDEYLESIKDEQGLTKGQVYLLEYWASRLYYVGYGHLPDQVANFLLHCKSYRGMPPELRQRLHPI